MYLKQFAAHGDLCKWSQGSSGGKNGCGLADVQRLRNTIPKKFIKVEKLTI